MRSRDVSQLPNPFALDPSELDDDSTGHKSPSKFSRYVQNRLLRSSARWFVMAIIGVSIMCLVTYRRGNDRVETLTSDFDSLNVVAKQERLAELAALGARGVPGVVHAIADPSEQVAETSIKLLSDVQTSWASMPKDEAKQSRQVLEASLREIVSTLPQERRQRIEFLIARVSPVSSPSRLVATAKTSIVVPPPVAIEQPIDWPRPKPRVIQVGHVEPIESPSTAELTKLIPAEDEPVLLQQVDTIAEPQRSGTIEETVFRQADSSTNAKPSGIIDQLAVGNKRQRIAAIDQLGTELQMTEEARDWVLSLLNHRDRDVRLHAVAALEKTTDETVGNALRQRLTIEWDQMVALRIRTALSHWQK